MCNILILQKIFPPYMRKISNEMNGVFDICFFSLVTVVEVILRQFREENKSSCHMKSKLIPLALA